MQGSKILTLFQKRMDVAGRRSVIEHGQYRPNDTQIRIAPFLHRADNRHHFRAGRKIHDFGLDRDDKIICSCQHIFLQQIVSGQAIQNDIVIIRKCGGVPQNVAQISLIVRH